MAPQKIDRHTVFLNLPYDNNFAKQSLAYIAAVSVSEMMRIYRALQSATPAIQRKTGSKTFFTASFFSELSATAAALTEKYMAN